MEARALAASRRLPAFEPNRDQEQRTGQDAGQLGGQVGQPQPVLKHGDGEQAQQRARHAASAPEDRRAAQNDRGDRRQLVAGAGVGLGLTEMSHIDHCRQARDQSRQHVHQPDETVNRQPGISGPFRRETDRDQAAAEGGAVQQHPEQAAPRPRRSAPGWECARAQ